MHERGTDDCRVAHTVFVHAVPHIRDLLAASRLQSTYVQLILQGIQIDIDSIFSVTDTPVYGEKSTSSFSR